MKKYVEIYFTKSEIKSEDWQSLIYQIGKYLGLFHKWKFVISLEEKIHYYIETSKEIPIQFLNLEPFLFKEQKEMNYVSFTKTKWYKGSIFNTLLETIDKNQLQKEKDLKQVQILFVKIGEEKILSFTDLYFKKNNTITKEKMIESFPASFLEIKFQQQKHFQYQKLLTKLDIKKTISLFTTESKDAIFEVDPFPYLKEENYLDLLHYDFSKHSMIVGASGSGKSKMISLMIGQLQKTPELKKQYKIVIIDPHASIEQDIGGLVGVKTIDFMHEETGISLFDSSKQNPIATTELIISLFASMLASNYNSKLERVLRFSIYLLYITNNFNFQNFRKLLLDLEYRLNVIKQTPNIPDSVCHFFLNDFNELKNKSYNEAIAPLISFLDEMELNPVLNKPLTGSLRQEVKNNFVTLFSLNRTQLGDKVLKTIAGFIMQQMLELAQEHIVDEQILFIIDEVSILENPILTRILSEARKYGLFLFLSQQYFGQISSNLKDAIFANMMNYYIFRVARTDATLLAGQLNMVMENGTVEDKINLLTSLKNRECVIEVTKSGTLYPVFKAKTRTIEQVPRIQIEYQDKVETKNILKEYLFNIDTECSLQAFFKMLSASRKKMK